MNDMATSPLRLEKLIAARTTEPAVFNPDDIGETNGNGAKPEEA